MCDDQYYTDYFEWMYDLVCGARYSRETSYKKLLRYLHSVEFRYSIPRDSNRAVDGVDLRYRFFYMNEYDTRPNWPDDYECSVLEMMVALSIKCEDIMGDDRFGDRTGQWFWGMIVNLGLGSMTDDRFDELYAEDVINIFLDRRYDPDGKGGLFRIKHCRQDLRNVEIWYQMCWYLDTLI